MRNNSYLIINSMSGLYQFNKVIVNSLYKDQSETNANFTVKLPNNLQNVKAVAFNNIIFPNAMSVWKGSGYGANQNNQFTFIDDVGGAPSTVVITVPEFTVFGDGDELASFLQTELNSATAGGYTVSFDLGAGAKLTIANGTRNFTFQNSVMPKAGLKLGFTGTTADYTNKATITGEANINLIRTSIVYVRSNIAGNDCVTDQGQDIYDVAVVVPILSTYASIINFSSSNDRVVSEQLSGIQELAFRLQDEEGDDLYLTNNEAPTAYTHMELFVEYTSLDDPLEKPQPPSFPF